jgi:hypothetical protein
VSGNTAVKSAISLSAAAALILGIATAMASSAAERLSAPLELKVSQSGFAGVTGTVTTIEPDGTYRVSGFVNDMTRPPESEGKLQPEALDELARSLESRDFARLPAELGETPPVNAKTLTLRYGGHSTTLSLPPGTDLPAGTAARAGGPEGDFAAIVQSIREAVGDP